MNKRLHTFFFTLLVGIYITTTIGIPVYLHYCGGELEDVSAFVKKVSCCEGEDEQEADDCCNNVTKHISFKADFISAKQVKMDVVKFISTSFLNNVSFEIKFRDDIPFKNFVPESPPSKRSSEIISTCVFRI